jgi:FKBP-type peptidyl-prolyl cis-trans isomerase
MTLLTKMRWTIAVGVLFLVATAAAQQATNQPQPEAKASSQTEEAKAPEVKAPPEAAAASVTQKVEPVVMQSRKDKISYAFGVDLARDIQRQKDEVNVDLMMRALTDTLAGKPLVMTDEEVKATLKKFEEEQKHDYEHAKSMIGERNKREGETFFSENAKKDGVVTLPSGLQYKILKQADGKKPAIDDQVVCHYRGMLVDGTEFDSSYKRNEPVTLPVRSIMAGWTQALQLMPVGSKWQIVIPPQLAYGEKIVAGLGPNATLIFEVELLSIKDKSQDKAQTASAAK